MKILTFLFLLFTLTTGAQTAITITVNDAETNSTLPFASITLHNKNFIADGDGKLVLQQPIDNFTVSYTGFKSQKITVAPGVKFYRVALNARPEVLKEMVINATNPAHEIMGRALRRKPGNDPQSKLQSFKYKTYERLVVSANPDSISGKLDSVFAYEKIGKRFMKLDSSSFKFKKIISRQHLYQTEKVSEYKYNKEQGLKEEVLATRMAGFKQPLYEFIGLKLQSYSVYTDKVALFETRYTGPMADDALLQYNYKILDTVSINNRNAYVIYFSPKRNKKNKLNGVLYIDTATYGVAQAVFKVKNVMNITSTHYFKFKDSLNIWFPDRKTLNIVKGTNNADIKILGETIKFDAIDSHDKKRREKEPSDFLYVYSESNNFDEQYNVPVTIRRSSVAIEIKDAAINRPESYWNQFRRDTLDSRSVTTYMTLDSLVAKDNWEKRIIFGRRVINGYIPAGPVDIDLRKIVKYNNYEGFRLGIGGITNDKLSEVFRISAYGAYGTKDGVFKYSLGAAVRVGKFSNSWIGGSYTDDIKEIGSTSFTTDKSVFKIYDPRPINLSTFYNHQSWQGYIETKILPKTESMWQLTRSRIDPKFNYIYNPDGMAYSVFDITTAAVSVQWNPFSDFMQTPNGRIEIEKRFPKFAFQYTQSLAGVLGSDFNFGKIDFRAEYEKKYLNGQMASFLLQTGLAIGDTPLTHMYSTSPNNLDKNGVVARITFAGKNSFETMYFNEFFSSRYLMAQVKHGIKRFTVFRSIKLSPMFVSRFAWGAMDNLNDHVGLQYNTLEKGYLESGFEFNEIFKGLGLSTFYRYGAYHLPQFDRNISVKLSYVLNLF
jgi:hypothetical protein